MDPLEQLTARNRKGEFMAAGMEHGVLSPPVATSTPVLNTDDVEPNCLGPARPNFGTPFPPPKPEYDAEERYARQPLRRSDLKRAGIHDNSSRKSTSSGNSGQLSVFGIVSIVSLVVAVGVALYIAVLSFNDLKD